MASDLLHWLDQPDLHRAVAVATEHIARHPDDAMAYRVLGEAQFRLGDTIAGIASLAHSLSLDPAHDTFLMLARALRAIASLDKALSVLEAGLQTHETSDGLLGEWVDIHVQQGAGAACEQVLQERVADSSAPASGWHQLGRLFHLRGDLERAADAYQNALQREGTHATWWDELGNVQMSAEAFAQAADSYTRAVQCNPQHLHASSNLGLALHAAGRLPEAIAAFDRALLLAPSSPELRMNRCLSLMLSGRRSEGFREYEWRRHVASFRLPPPDPRLDWDGSDLGDHDLLILPEQGLGDVLQFCRFVPLIKKTRVVRTVYFAAPPKLLPILSSLPDVTVIDETKPLPPAARRAYLLSLPHLLGATDDSVLSSGPYLMPPAADRERWKERLTAQPGFRVALAWQGNPNGVPARSVPFEHISRLLRSPTARYMIIQKFDGRETLHTTPGLTFEDLDADNRTFIDTAAIMLASDVVVTNDTATGHLAGALGCETWLMTMHVPDWRWSLHGETTPWYPSTRFYRQPSPGDWGPVVGRIDNDIRARVAALKATS